MYQARNALRAILVKIQLTLDLDHSGTPATINLPQFLLHINIILEKIVNKGTIFIVRKINKRTFMVIKIEEIMQINF